MVNGVLGAPRVTSAAHAAALAATVDVAGAGPVRFSSPIDATQPVQFSRPTMVMDDEPDAPRQRRVGAGWVGSRTQGGGGGGGGGQPQPQSRPETPGPISAVVGPNGQITLTWEDLSTNETGFAVDHQMLINSSWETSGTFTAGPGREQLIVTVPMGEHRFRVAAYNPGGMSTPTDWGAVVQTTDPVDVALIPLMPANVLAERIAAETVRVSWDDASANETSFEVERDPPFSDGTRAVAANVTVYEDTGANGDFRYRVRSVNEHGESGWAGWVDISETDLPPAAPGSFAANDAGNGNSIRLTWVDNSSNETSFAIERQQQVGGQWGTTTELSASANATEYVDPSGTGTFRYRVAARNDAGSSPWSMWATATVTAAGGWTEFTRSSDTRVVYVSSSEGNDSNDGLSEDRPKRTIAAGKAVIRNGYPDWLLFKRGDVWTNESFGQWTASGRSASERVVVGAYGTSPERPEFRTGNQGAFTTRYGPAETTQLSNIAIIGLEFWPHTDDGTTGVIGVRWLMPGSDILIEDCYIHHYTTNLSIQGRANSSGSDIHNFVLRRNVITDAYSVGAGHSQGIFMSGSHEVLIEENVFDHNGWSETIGGAPATVFNRNLYLARNNSGIVTRGNISARSASEGLQQRSGGVCEENLFLQNSAGVMWGQWQSEWPQGATSGVVRNNVILDARDIADGPRGHGIWMQKVDDAEVYGNIIAHQRSGTGNVFGIYADYEHLNVSIHDNIVYKWVKPDGEGVGIGFGGTTLGPVSVNNNQVVQNRSGMLISAPASAQFSFDGNNYFSEASSGNWFRRGSTRMSYSEWVNAVGEDDASNQRPDWVDPERTIETYMALQGRSPTLEAFLAEARLQSRSNWRPEFTAARVNEYIREGFEIE